jgi:predicted ATPase/class 3 adenylate cyclase
MTAQPPSGTVTFLLTDLEGSTRLWEQDAIAMKAAMVRHDEILEKTITANGGFIFSRMGDGMAVAFSSAGNAISSAVSIKNALAEEDWRTATPLKARIGIHTAEAVIVDDSGYASLPINRCARLMAAAHGGQVLVSDATEPLIRDELPDGMCLADLGEHRLRDLGSPMRIFEVGRHDNQEAFPPLRSLAAFPGNLPAQVSTFIGRETDVQRVVLALGESRVVTITGVGGVGKTRLALQVAADVLPRYRDGAWLVELAPLRDPDAVVSAIAAQLRMTGGSGQSLENPLIEMLASKELLLLLDNCEHLVGPVAQLVSRIERECPNVVVLATSREGLAVGGEQLIALAPLAVGQPGESVEQLVHTDAVRLFVERARHVKADFALMENNAHAVVEACRRLDGVPLAIELAAARVIALSPAELVTRLDRRFQLLAGGRRGAVDRHATLRAAIDWSYDLLNEGEQRLLARLSVFAGGCALEAIEDVCSGGPVERDAVVDLITALVARSLVIAEDRGLGTRYRLLETIRQYGEERLTDWGETDDLLTRHGWFYAALLADTVERSYGPEQLVGARRLNVERDNLRAALANAIDRDNGPLAVQLVANDTNRHVQGAIPGTVLTEPVLRVFQLSGAQESPGYARALMVAAYQEVYALGDWASAKEHGQQALDAERVSTAPRHGPRIEMDSWSLRAVATFSAGKYGDAVDAYSRAAAVACEDGYPGLAATYLAYGVNARLLGGVGHPEDAIAEAEEAMALAHRSGMPSAIVVSADSLALAVAEADPQRARAILQESIQREALTQEVSGTFVTVSMVAGRLRDWELTLKLSARSMRVWRWDRSALWAAICLAECARAFAEDRPSVAGVLRGAAYGAFSQASPVGDDGRRPDTSQIKQNANFVLAALRETGELVDAALGDNRRRELHAQGAAMTIDEAVSYALDHIDSKLLTGPDSYAQPVPRITRL